ncbi:lasso peptide biosynthesis B2 protein, partial [Streptomyces sp. UNOB3_S3]|uniref:lasso peptide biosynthesis B2 protein n=1 Tax=Streptomyces sp. UNOB3_S3 TaxID=2871682 RepID=UPI001E56EA03
PPPTPPASWHTCRPSTSKRCCAQRAEEPNPPPTRPRCREHITAVSVLCSGRYCLRRSLATVLLCRLGGTWPTWCTGVRTAPFAAHAWVEAEGRPVGEPGDTAGYRPMLTVPPRY